MIEVPLELRSRMEAHALAGYPAEACGVLLGRDGKVRRVAAVREATNLRASTRWDRYEIDPQDLLAAEREARQTGLVVLGFYHSHPDVPAAPSATDTARAWPWYTYLILATTEQGVRDARAYRLDGERMDEEPLRFIAEQPVGGVEDG